jgi:hypothetical protein
LGGADKTKSHGNRGLRGAIAGHLAMCEMTSSRPNQLYGIGFRRLGFETEVTEYFDEHVEADAVFLH